jgi:hypothetical protein
MTNSKPWYLSRTIWASLITIVTAAAGILGLPVAGLDNAALTETLLQAITAISGLAAISAGWERAAGLDRTGSMARNRRKFCLHVHSPFSGNGLESVS